MVHSLVGPRFGEIKAVNKSTHSAGRQHGITITCRPGAMPVIQSLRFGRHGRHVNTRMNIHIFCFNFDALAQGSDFESRGEKLSSSGETRIRSIRRRACTCMHYIYIYIYIYAIHATEIVSKTQHQWHGRGGTENWQPLWNTQLSISTPMGDIYQLWMANSRDLMVLKKGEITQ